MQSPLRAGQNAQPSSPVAQLLAPCYEGVPLTALAPSCAVFFWPTPDTPDGKKKQTGSLK